MADIRGLLGLGREPFSDNLLQKARRRQLRLVECASRERAERDLHEAIRVVAAWPTGYGRQEKKGPSDHRQAAITAYINLRDYIRAYGIHDG